jgi:hypothetical protein
MFVALLETEEWVMDCCSATTSMVECKPLSHPVDATWDASWMQEAYGQQQN